MTTSAFAVASTRAYAHEAAEACLTHYGTALDAVLAGFLAVAGATPDVLLAPLVLAVAGPGAGRKFFDGRARQPGHGLLRPTRYPQAEAAPVLARISVPTTPAVLALASAADGAQRLRVLAAEGLRRAKQAEATERGRLLEAVVEEGGKALGHRWFTEEVARRAPRIEGCPLTPADLAAARPSLEIPPVRFLSVAVGLGVPPWSREGDGMLVPSSGGRDVVIAADHRGGIAVALWERPTSGITLFGGQILLPALAEPLVRGIPRLAPGTPIATPTPIAFLTDDQENPVGLLVTDGRVLSETSLQIATDLLTPRSLPSAFGTPPTSPPSPMENSESSTTELFLLVRARHGQGPTLHRRPLPSPSIY